MKKINVNKTLEAIMNESNDFKIIDNNEEAGIVTIATSVDDSFSRSVIMISSEMIAAGHQAPDEEGKIVLSYTPIGVDLVSIIVYDTIEQSKEDVKEVDEELEAIENQLKKNKAKQ